MAEQKTGLSSVRVILSVFVALTCAGAVAAAPSHRDDIVDAKGDPSDKRLWEAGVGGVIVQQLAYPGSSVRVRRSLVLPYVLYRGQYFRAVGDGIGVRPIRRPRYELDIGLAAAFGASGSDVPVREGMPNIGTLAEFGPQLKINLGALDGSGRWRLHLPLRAAFDVSSHFKYRGLSFAPKVVYKRRLSSRLRLVGDAGFLFANRKLADTYYGVAPEFVTATRAGYRARQGLISTRLTLALHWHVSRNWRLTGFTRLDNVSGASNADSPLVERRMGATFGLSFGWRLSESDQPAFQ